MKLRHETTTPSNTTALLLGPTCFSHLGNISTIQRHFKDCPEEGNGKFEFDKNIYTIVSEVR